MKRIRAEKRLRAKDIGTLPAGVYEDGGGLRLLVEPSGARRWVLRVTIAGKRCYRGLGSYHLVSLEKARDKATDIRRAAREGRDLVAVRRREGTTFRQAFDEHLEHRQRGMLNAKHVWQWRAGIEAHAFPVIGDRPVSEITHDEIIAVLKPIWHVTPETARRVLQRMEIIFKLAISRGLRERASPCTGVSEDLGKQRDVVEHHRALPYGEVSAFIRTLRACGSDPITKLAFEWLILTATRSARPVAPPSTEVQGDQGAVGDPEGAHEGAPRACCAAVDALRGDRQAGQRPVSLQRAAVSQPPDRRGAVRHDLHQAAA